MTRETPSTSPLEREDDLAKLERFIEQATESYRAEGIPVGSEGRIDMRAYGKLHPDVEEDIARNREWEKGWFGDVSEHKARAKRRRREGEQLEMLAYAVFIKNLGEQFVVARASPHDDRVNNVDTVILNRATGALVCAFDEVGDTTSVDYQKKLSNTQNRNIGGGASLKYGIGIEGSGGKRTVVPAPAVNVPLFYIALPHDRIQQGIKEFVPDAVNQSEYEKKLFTYFVASITAQIENLELYGGRLNPKLKENLASFKRVVDALRTERKAG